MTTQDDILAALRTVKYPGFSRDIVSFGLVKDTAVDQQGVAVRLQLSSASPQITRQIQDECERALRTLDGVSAVRVEILPPGGGPGTAASPNPWANQRRVPDVHRVLAVASGKGGVGKSTVAVNLACSLQRLGKTVGILDGDIYGPSIPLMMGVNRHPSQNDRQQLVPPANHGIKLMSIGFMIDIDQPVIWRGPMIVKAIQEFLFSVDWGTLDCLLVDLPPGTGDAQLSLCQAVPLDGGIVVTTPQQASVGVVRKGIAMLQKVNVPVVGVIENMSYFAAPNGERIEIFGHGGGRAEAARQGLPFLGEIPIYPEIREAGDRGVPVVISAPDSKPSQAFLEIATRLSPQLG